MNFRLTSKENAMGVSERVTSNGTYSREPIPQTKVQVRTEPTTWRLAAPFNNHEAIGAKPLITNILDTERLSADS